MKSNNRKSQKQKRKTFLDPAWELINPDAAGIDIGSRQHWACVPARSCGKNMCAFGTFTADLEKLPTWL